MATNDNDNRQATSTTRSSGRTWRRPPDKGGSGGVLKPGPLKDAIDQAFGGLDSLKKTFNAQTAAHQGSGWGWVVSVFLFLV